MRYTAEEFQKKLNRWAKTAPEKLKKAMDVGGLDIQKDVQQNRLRGQVLNSYRPPRTGTLMRSIHFLSDISGKRITLKIGTNVGTKKGFAYGKHWERDAKKPRPFLKPSVAARKQFVISRIADAMMGAYKKA